jgi:YebC/PmpR family DNA-binding regulatory protein
MPKFKNFKNRKGAADQARNNQFVKLAKEIFVEARKGGADINANPRLNAVVVKARQINMPKDNIERALKKALNQGDTTDYEVIRYEGYGPAGVAVIVDCLTDNRNRSAADVRAIFNKRGGNMGETGCVSWMFDEKGVLVIERESTEIDEDSLLLLALEAGAEDMSSDDEVFEIITSPGDYDTVKNTLEKKRLPLKTAEVTFIPQNTVNISGEDAVKMMKMMDAFDENDDVQNVYANFDIDDEELERIQ